MKHIVVLAGFLISVALVRGAFRYDTTKDILRADAPVEKQSGITEAFSIVFQKAGKGANLVFNWDDILVKLPISW